MSFQRYLVDIDLYQNQLISGVFHRLAAAPSLPANGQVYFDTTLKIPRYYDAVGSAWYSMGAGAVTWPNLTGGANTTESFVVSGVAKLGPSGGGIVNANQFNGNPVISIADGGTNQSSYPTGSIPIGSGNILAPFAGSGLMVLRSNDVPQLIGPVASGGTLISNGISWISDAAGDFVKKLPRDSSENMIRPTIDAHGIQIQQNPSAVLTPFTIEVSGQNVTIFSVSAGGNLSMGKTITFDGTGGSLVIGTVLPKLIGYKSNTYDGGTIEFGSAASGDGGDLWLFGSGMLPGGSIYTHAGGGGLNTRGSGLLELGASGTRTTLRGSATTNIVQTFPDQNGILALRQGEISPVAITGHTLNYVLNNDNDFHRIYATGNHGYIIHGFSPGYPGRQVLLQNVGDRDIVINHLSNTASGGYKVQNPYQIPIVLRQYDTWSMIYDSIHARWEVLNGYQNYLSDPMYCSYLYDDFVGGSNTTTNTGDNGLIILAANSATIGIVGSEYNVNGVLRLSTNTTSATAAAGVGTLATSYRASGNLIYTCVARPETLSTAANHANIAMGITNSMGFGPAGGAFFLYNLVRSSSWLWVLSSGTAAVNSGSTNVIVTTGYNTFKIIYNQTEGRVHYFINGSGVGTHSGALIPPSTTLGAIALITSTVGTGFSKRMLVDSLSVNACSLVRRGQF